MSAVVEQRPLRVLVVDDEPPGLKRLLRLLGDEPRVDVVGTAENGVEAIDAIRRLGPDLVFLDIQMPHKTGLEVVQEIGSEAMPVTIFVTAYDEYALRAFELAAVDYLVKPYDDERFEQAFRRARRMIEMEGRNRTLDQLLAVLHGGSTPVAAHASAPAKYLDRIAAHKRGGMTVIPVAQIDYVMASGPYSELHVGGQSHLVREAIQALEEQLDPERFLRIHRSIIVRMEIVDALVRAPSGDLEVQLRGGPRLRVGRSRRDIVQRRLGRL
jgi:two-component system, LytTR family, response regulator